MLNDGEARPSQRVLRAQSVGLEHVRGVKHLVLGVDRDAIVQVDQVANAGGDDVDAGVVSQGLEGADLDAVKTLAKEGGFYTLSLPSVLSDPDSPAVLASVSACALLASRFEERLQLTMSGKDRLVALSYVLPKVPPRCPTDGLPRLALDEVLFNTSAVQLFPREGPRPYGKIHEASFLPPAAAAAAAKAAAAAACLCAEAPTAVPCLLRVAGATR